MLKLFCLACLVAVSQAIVCTENICAAVDCMQLTADNCDGTIKAGGGFCGCCDSCINEIAEGQRCSSIFLLGLPPTAQCADGLVCDPSTHTCQKAVSKKELGLCAQKLAEVNAQLEASNHMLLGLEKPHCDDNGDYQGMQYSGSQAYCVTKDGHMIDGYMVNRWETGTDLSCQCARDLYNYMKSGLIGKLFYCDPNGSYPKTTTAPATA